MKLSKFFKYGFLATCLLGNVIAMDNDDKNQYPYGQSFPGMVKDVGNIIISNMPFQDIINLGSTCKSWGLLVKEYSFLFPSLNFFEEININIHPDLYGEIMNVDCTPQSLCIFLPFQENTATEKTPTWNQTTGWSINGYTGKIEKLTPFNGEIRWCCNASHPQGIVLGALNQAINLLTVNDARVEIKPAFPGIEEADGFGDFFPNFLCNISNVVFISSQNNRDVISCYNLNNVQQKRVVNLPSLNSRAFNFGKKFLVTGNYPNSLQVINPKLEALIEKSIDLPTDIISQDVTLLPLTSDQDSVLISAQNFSLESNQLSYFVIKNISSDQPTPMRVSFLSEGYKPVGYYLKNNYIFSVASLIAQEELPASHQVGEIFDEKINEKSGVFAIHDLNNQLLYKKFFSNIPLATYYIGNTIFVSSIMEAKKTCVAENQYEYDLANSIQSLSAFNIKHFLI